MAAPAEFVPFAQCPACDCYGHHPMRYRPAIPGDPAEVVQVVSWGGGVVRETNPSAIPAHYERYCVFCSHLWNDPQ